MNKKTVLVTKPIQVDAFQRLEQEANVLTPSTGFREEVLGLLPRVHGIVLGGVFRMGPFEQDLAKSLEVIGRNGVGLDNVDVVAASERGIPVTYTPYGPTESTAEHALTLILATARRLVQMDRAVRGGDFQIGERLEAMGRELDGMTLGVVGFGRIGQRLAEMCRDALRMEVFVYDPYLDSEAVSEWGAVPVGDLIELAGKVDVLSVHAPLTTDTRGLVSGEVIQTMKPGAIILCCNSRTWC
jgi:D-3-phosphoglycerate dehydrogenase